MNDRLLKIGQGYAVNIGKQIQNLQCVWCPRCLESSLNGSVFKQNLCAVGDYEDELFCPHCELNVLIKVEIRD